MKRLTKRNKSYYTLYDEEITDGSIGNWYEKLSMLEDIEEELGCSLDVLFKALNDGIWYQDRNKLLYEPLPAFRECCIYVSDFDTYVSPSDYKKTWWLKETKEE